jgi:ubiquinone/menaquinone biosynthesis C-methylase UbiE
MAPVPKEIEEHYLLGQEERRLSAGQGELEWSRTRSILARLLPPPPAVVLDVGGAAGAYAFPLAEHGYTVHLIDPVELHLEQARACSAQSKVALASISAGDARKLDLPSEIADALLLFGPLYHLIEPADRLIALREAHRVLKPQGMLFAAAISRFASLIDGLTLGYFQDPAFREIVSADLTSGQHRNPINHPGYFTTAYFHRPEELAREVDLAGFRAKRILAVEGPVWAATRLRESWADPVQRSRLLEFLADIESEPSIVGASAHFLAVAHR